ncbi:MAG TPA: transporter substrate-binding domain-containing protein [Alphaproteobacteria bacterium]
MKTIIGSAFVALIVSLAVIRFYPSSSHQDNIIPATQKAFDHVVQSHELRCGYLIYPPNFMVDPNTKEFSGIFYDAVEAMGKELNLKVKWQEEGSYDILIQSLQSGRIDAICSGLWENPAKAAVLDFSDYFFFNELAVYARADDTRFDYALDKLNSPDVSFAVIEGAMADQIAKAEYPKAKRHALPPLSDFPQLLMEVSSKKSDVTISATQEILTYDKNNQDQLHKVKTDKPFRLFPNVIFVKKGETDLLNMLNVAVHQIKHTGILDSIITQYEQVPGTLLRTNSEYDGVSDE